MKILLVEDNLILCETLSKLFKNNSIGCDVANDGETGLLKAINGYYDVIILDIALPKKSGTEILSDLRSNKNNTPILMLTAKDHISDKEISFEIGADDYLTKPFLHKELLLRIKAIARRPREMLDGYYIQAGNVRLNAFNNQIEMNGSPVNASAKAAQLLYFLFKHKENYVPKEVILQAVWGIEKPLQTNNVEVYIHMLRKTFPPEQSGFTIMTKLGVGYMLREVMRDV